MTRNWITKGDKVKLKDGNTVTITSLDLHVFTCKEKIGYIKKSEIIEIIN